MSNLANYSPEDVIVQISNDIFGTYQITGMIEGTFISYDRTVARSELVVGSDLSAARVLRRNKAGTVTLSLMQTAESNDVLSMIALRDEESHDNRYLFTVTISDTLGRSYFFAPEAFIGNDPQVTYSNGVEGRDWTITVVKVDRHFGGNSKVDPESEAVLNTLGYQLEDKWKVN